MLAPKSGWWLSMVLITFLTLKFEKSYSSNILEEFHQYRSNCYESWLKRSGWMHLRIWIGLYVGSEVWLVAEYGAYQILDNEAQEHIVEELHQYRSTCYEIWL